ncbi:hypothetical protein LOTGIDRAFT_175446 [Lottia gigantea]|uniref:Uncharacterized protein n=1 Tax=Lottia gigantea TaxID=225164 RepID=V4ALD5_LOTGI|nr:hypothetical protein LOTGIDRAFT_175446 [Lottia gigantea]ESO94391.1 hypothetical protein LOTGIDRAFT_175446 [Lottia gigantea]
MVDKNGDEIIAYVVLGGILAALVVFVSFGVYYYQRYGNGSSEINTNIEMLNLGDNEAPKNYSKEDNSSTNFSHGFPIFYMTGKNSVGKRINYTARTTGNFYLEVLYIHLGPKSCEKVKFYSEKKPTFGLSCTDFGMTMFYKDIGHVGRKFSLEIDGLKLEESEVIYFKLSGHYIIDTIS